MILIKYSDLLFLGVTVAGIAILGFIIYFNDKTNITNKTFLSFSLVTVGWGVFNYLNYNVINEVFILWFIRLVMFFAIFQAYYFFKLMYVFPDKTIDIDKKLHKISFAVVLFVAGLTLTPWVFSGVIKNSNNPVYQPQSEFGIAIFAIATILLVFLGFFFLWKKYKQANNKNQKNQFVLLFIGTLLMFSLIIIFNLILPVFFKNTRFIPFGALFVFPFIILTFYAFYKHKLFNV